MQIKILDQVFECDNQVSSVEDVFDKVNQILTETKQHIGSLEIDGVEVYQDYIQYITANLDSIGTIVVNMKTLREMLEGALVSIQEYLSRAIPEVEILADEFYQGISQNTWEKFAQLFDGLQLIIDSIQIVSEHPELYSNVVKFVEIKDSIIEQLSLLQAALESQDRVSVGDLMLYRLIPSFQMLQGEIAASSNSGKIN
ncbi:hypothetical protein P22_0487 [Propionispora sp. 2/2-37]|uniref:hypothetical protein n=1 Tax=Propionispora sp. 2/2-37 TaxID=1677858 RepID=UPI0006BB55E5|nr:hypothetical protein [Propionispora sp. 2/2-37]CUH94421.1 hypothetical protein P22_0487 [Propionispora sp. 2/2-37]